MLAHPLTRQPLPSANQGPANRTGPLGGGGTFATQLQIQIPPNGSVLITPSTSVVHTWTLQYRNGQTVQYNGATAPWVTTPFQLDGVLYESVTIDAADASSTWVTVPSGSAPPFAAGAQIGVGRVARTPSLTISGFFDNVFYTCPAGRVATLQRLSIVSPNNNEFIILIEPTAGGAGGIQLFNGTVTDGSWTAGPEPQNNSQLNPLPVLYPGDAIYVKDQFENTGQDDVVSAQIIEQPI